jgi:hypothetical protein
VSPSKKHDYARRRDYTLRLNPWPSKFGAPSESVRSRFPRQAPAHDQTLVTRARQGSQPLACYRIFRACFVDHLLVVQQHEVHSAFSGSRRRGTRDLCRSSPSNTNCRNGVETNLRVCAGSLQSIFRLLLATILLQESLLCVFFLQPRRTCPTIFNGKASST